MLEICENGDWERGAAASEGCRDPTAMPRTVRAAQIAAAELRNCNRDIVNLKRRRGRLVASQAAPRGADVTIPAAPPACVRRVDSLPSARKLPHGTLADEGGKQTDGRQPALTLSAQAAVRRMTVPANASLNQQASRPRQTRSEFVTTLNRRRRAPWQVLFPFALSLTRDPEARASAGAKIVLPDPR